MPFLGYIGRWWSTRACLKNHSRHPHAPLCGIFGPYAEELEDVDTESSSVLEHRKYAESIQASRDNIKIRKRSTAHNVEFVMLGMENQEYIDYAMPLRVMGYEHGTYKKQYEDNAKKYVKASGLDGDEYLSKMKKTDRFIPVITIVVYYGEKPWDGATSLHGMLKIDEKIAGFVNDHRMLLVEARKNDLGSRDRKNVDLFNLFEILLDMKRSAKEIKDRVIDYVQGHKIEKSVFVTAVSVTDYKIDRDILGMEGDMGMYMSKVFRETWAEGEAKGREEGREEGRAEGIIETGEEFGLSKDAIIERLQKNLDISIQKAQGYYERFKKECALR